MTMTQQFWPLLNTARCLGIELDIDVDTDQPLDRNEVIALLDQLAPQAERTYVLAINLHEAARALRSLARA